MKFKEKHAIYLQIADYISEKILLGTWVTGSRIPSARELATDLQVNYHTVIRTYDHLESNGILTNSRGIGYSVNDRAVDQILLEKRARFIDFELPEFIKSMRLLNISIGELQAHYQTLSGLDDSL